MPRNKKDPEFPCPSACEWKTWRADSGREDQSNIICEEVDCVIATNLPTAQARQIVTNHNGYTT
ncbi:hypothetical protein HPDFL43_00018570 [Hoeflea phototrophica DFL-43]|uniref:Uncharacterized protein n=1 Tax=Hoeflea phototrophica (strain DSM 17068 / NCIMB 14078 / DFL-43) TaxID=411684 RepID=A0A094Z2C3_HOEPD|nr:hypothetical protein HPDFL43_00018570 [Hoeflea phototrophica DFL-43]